MNWLAVLKDKLRHKFVLLDCLLKALKLLPSDRDCAERLPSKRGSENAETSESAEKTAAEL